MDINCCKVRELQNPVMVENLKNVLLYKFGNNNVKKAIYWESFILVIVFMQPIFQFSDCLFEH